jgi:hypothetical protein
VPQLVSRGAGLDAAECMNETKTRLEITLLTASRSMKPLLLWSMSKKGLSAS